jgi:hypothetical protein
MMRPRSNDKRWENKSNLMKDGLFICKKFSKKSHALPHVYNTICDHIAPKCSPYTPVIKVIDPKTGKRVAYLIPSKKLSYDQIEAISVMATKKDRRRYTKFLTHNC